MGRKSLTVGVRAKGPDRIQFDSMRDTLAASPEARAAVEAGCRAQTQAKPQAEREMIGAMLDLDPDEVASAFCARFVAGIARGDLSHADFVAMAEGSDDPQVLRRFIRALRLDPSAVAI